MLGPTWRTLLGIPYLPHIWVGYEGGLLAQAFETCLRRPPVFSLSTTDRTSSRTFETGLGRLGVDAIMPLMLM